MSIETICQFTTSFFKGDEDRIVSLQHNIFDGITIDQGITVLKKKNNCYGKDNWN